MTDSTMTVLMVDDNAALREAIARSLVRRGCEVVTVATSAEALDAARRQSFDAVITDLNVPGTARCGCGGRRSSSDRGCAVTSC